MKTKERKVVHLRWLGVPLISLLAACGGSGGNDVQIDDVSSLSFSKTAMTDSYKLEYVPGMRGAINGQTKFTLKVSDLSGTPQEGLDVSIKPKMDMTEMVHGTPFETTCNESDVVGAYDCRVYYLMPSVMMNGMSMGSWELKVMVGGHDGEYAYFYPKVTMAMGDTAQARLKGQNDKISSSMNHDSDMNGNGMQDETEARTYYLFKQALTGVTNNHSFEFFIAAKDNMMNYPAVSMGSTLSVGDMRHELSVTTMSVEVSSDANDWTFATEKEGQPGYWVASGIPGLTDGSQGTLYVKLKVEGEQKTTDGFKTNGLPASDDANNHFAKFNVTPSHL
ncbi:MAG: hypothetical protein L3J70_02205 [Gammaproteobacteria bacterium]|nr:hypothetical protein [Gammaproteobacteria bacterium]